MYKTKKLNVALVGLGKISEHYYEGLSNSETLELKAVVDMNPECQARKYFEKIPFYTNYSILYNMKDIDLAIVATSAESHYKIASDLISHNIPVVIEKPLTGSLVEIEDLIKLSKRCNTKMDCMFHWRFLPEIDYLKENMSAYGKLKKISLTIHDDYAFGGAIREDRKPMMGAWIDSGINAISMIDLILPLNQIKKLEEASKFDEETQYSIYTNKCFRASDVDIEIIVDWQEKRRDKTFVFEFENHKVVIFHSKQEIYVDNELVYKWKTKDSLSDQYTRIFKNYSINEADLEKAFNLHKVLFS